MAPTQLPGQLGMAENTPSCSFDNPLCSEPTQRSPLSASARASTRLLPRPGHRRVEDPKREAVHSAQATEGAYPDKPIARLQDVTYRVLRVTIANIPVLVSIRRAGRQVQRGLRRQGRWTSGPPEEPRGRTANDCLCPDRHTWPTSARTWGFPSGSAPGDLRNDGQTGASAWRRPRHCSSCRADRVGQAASWRIPNSRHRGNVGDPPPWHERSGQ